MGWFALASVVLVLGIATYIALRWRRAPAAFRAMCVVAGVCFAAGILAGVSILRLGSGDRRFSAWVMPNPKLTPGDVLPSVTTEDICTPGWAHDHRDVTQADKAEVYAEYPGTEERCQCPGCCEVDHLIPLELGGSNDIKNLWPEPEDPRPGFHEKDQLERTLHSRVCKRMMSLADAQKCIAADWFGCWKTYVPSAGA
jgi:hypothetical protein